MFQLTFITSQPIAVDQQVESGSTSSVSSHQVFIGSNKASPSILNFTLRLNNPSSLSLSLYLACTEEPKAGHNTPNAVPQALN